MNFISLKDNTLNQEFSVGKPFDSVRKALDSVAGKNLKSLADKDFKFIIYPPFSKELDVKCNDVIFNVDYSRTENVQFEDDEYFYYVKAIPKMSVEAKDVSVKRMRYRDDYYDDDEDEDEDDGLDYID